MTYDAISTCGDDQRCAHSQTHDTALDEVVSHAPATILTSAGTLGAPSSLALFGGLQIQLGGYDVVEQLPGRQGRALVAYLVLNRDRAVSRDELLNVLWPSQPPASPEAALSSILAKVRRALEPLQISGRQALTLQLAPHVQVDVQAVGEHIQRAESALADGDPATAL